MKKKGSENEQNDCMWPLSRIRMEMQNKFGLYAIYMFLLILIKQYVTILLRLTSKQYEKERNPNFKLKCVGEMKHIDEIDIFRR